MERVSCGCWSHSGFLTAKGLEETEQRGVDRAYELALVGRDGHLDKVVSVSGLRRDEGCYDAFAEVSDELLEEQSERFLNGCS